MNKAYSALAKVYEHFICDDDYQSWADYLVGSLKKYFEYASGIDCACGSGFFTRAIKRSGFEVIGVDSSSEMLAQAVSIGAREKLKIDYRLMDMISLKCIDKVDFITIINDGVNYVPPTKAPKMFNAFAKCLKVGGLLIFDVSSEYKIKNTLANNMFGEDEEDCSYLWFNRLYDDRIEMDISLFLKNELGLYTKQEESHTEYIYSESLLKSLMKECGFEILSICGSLGSELKAYTDRLIVTARKI